MRKMALVKLNKKYLLIIILFLFFSFIRIYDIENKSYFGWDQLDSAWAAKNIIVDHKFPLVGLSPKGSSGFSIGPFYYYYISAFYFLSNLDPIASGYAAWVAAMITFFAYFYVIKKIFSFNVAIIALIVITFSYHQIYFDRMQWGVNFVQPVSIMIFYALYKILSGNERYLLLLGFMLGFSFHVHFTSIMYGVIILLSLPFFPKKRSTVLFCVFSFFLFLLWQFSYIISEMTSKKSNTGALFGYLNTYYHGFHLRRVVQLAHDAFIEFESILFLSVLKPLKFILLPLFIFTSYKNLKNKYVIYYLMIIWFVVPWGVFSTYKGEISSYYFFITIPIVIMVISNLIHKLLTMHIAVRVITLVSLLYFIIINMQNFFTLYPRDTIALFRKQAKENIAQHKKVEYVQGSGLSYLYYIYTRK